MLTDPLQSPPEPMPASGSCDPCHSFALLPQTTDGKTIRVSRADATQIGGLKLTISQSKSNENKALGLETNRTLVRLDTSILDPNGKPASVFVYLVIGAPRTLTDSEAMTLKLVQSLMGILLTTGGADYTFSSDNLTRLQAGES